MKKLTLIALGLVAIAFGCSMAATAGNGKKPPGKAGGEVEVLAGDALPYLFSIDRARVFMPTGGPGGSAGVGLPAS